MREEEAIGFGSLIDGLGMVLEKATQRAWFHGRRSRANGDRAHATAMVSNGSPSNDSDICLTGGREMHQQDRSWGCAPITKV
jgi:hypothetical protein